jgi:hypothetical protein
VLIDAEYEGDDSVEWGASNYQRVVDLLGGRIPVVHIGCAAPKHPPLSGVIDLRGQTDLRQLVRVVSHTASGVGSSTLLQRYVRGLREAVRVRRRAPGFNASRAGGG